MGQNKPAKDTLFYLRSMPIFDSLGNMTSGVFQYNHIPTRQDSLNFIKAGYSIFPFLNAQDSIDFFRYRALQSIKKINNR